MLKPLSSSATFAFLLLGPFSSLEVDKIKYLQSKETILDTINREFSVQSSYFCNVNIRYISNAPVHQFKKE